MAESINLNELWHKACQNEVAAFAQIHKKLLPELSNYLMQMARDKHLVEDLLQNLFIKIGRKDIRSLQSAISGLIFILRAGPSLSITTEVPSEGPINYQRSHLPILNRQ